MHQELVQLGLTENEAKIYLAALGMKPFTAGDMATQTKIKRPTTYVALESLIKLGLITEDYANKRKIFRAERPKALEKLTKKMRRKTINAEILVERLIPSLNTIPVLGIEEPKLLFYEGISAIKNVLLDVAASKHSWYWFGASKKMIEKIAPEDLKEILEEGRKLRWRAWLPKIKFITDNGILDLPMFKKKFPSREIKILKQNITASSAMVIYEDKLMVLNFNHPFAVVIKSAEVAEIVTLMYNLIWDKL